MLSWRSPQGLTQAGFDQPFRKWINHRPNAMLSWRRRSAIGWRVPWWRDGVSPQLYRKTLQLDRVAWSELVGKSSTMRMISGLDAPTPGSISVNGRVYATHRA